MVNFPSSLNTLPAELGLWKRRPQPSHLHSVSDLVLGKRRRSSEEKYLGRLGGVGGGGEGVEAGEGRVRCRSLP